MKTIHRTYRFELRPTQEQKMLLAKHFGCTRFVYNYFLNQRQEQYREKGVKNNAVLIEKVKAVKQKQRINFIDFLSTIKDRALRGNVNNIQGYVISALKSEVK